MGEFNRFVSSMLDHHARADAALIRGDAGPRIALWSPQDPVTLFSAGGEARSGTAAITKFFRDLAAGYSNGRDFRFDMEAAEVGGDLAYSVGFERFKARSLENPETSSFVSLRSTGVRTACGRSCTVMATQRLGIRDSFAEDVRFIRDLLHVISVAIV
jgi:ketosteroid isomerase-like protein